MAISEAAVETANAGRYLVQLCKHWSHKFSVTFDEHEGRIEFEDSRCTLNASDAGLRITVEAPAEAIDRLQVVVAEHLNRFSHREGALTFAWRRIG